MIGSIDHGSARLVSSTFTLNLILNRSPSVIIAGGSPAETTLAVEVHQDVRPGDCVQGFSSVVV